MRPFSKICQFGIITLGQTRCFSIKDEDLHAEADERVGTVRFPLLILTFLYSIFFEIYGNDYDSINIV